MRERSHCVLAWFKSLGTYHDCFLSESLIGSFCSNYYHIDSVEVLGSSQQSTGSSKDVESFRFLYINFFNEFVKYVNHRWSKTILMFLIHIGFAQVFYFFRWYRFDLNRTALRCLMSLPLWGEGRISTLEWFWKSEGSELWVESLGCLLQRRQIRSMQSCDDRHLKQTF